ncbi:MAG: hypothetical protein LBC74_15520 [Planctomycetaceae bacterium]|jgi:hypothetical protein|nr:hypothetical protein [Planctomycetaceae bacterium]
MKKLFVLVFVGLCVSLISGCCNNCGNAVLPDNPPNNTPDTPSTPAPTTSGTYLTWDSGPIEIYVTNQPIEGVNDYELVEAGTGEYSSSEYYYSDMGILVPYATKWSDGSVTLSTRPYAGVDYEIDGDCTEFNDTTFVSNGSEYGEADGTEGDVWSIGTAPDGRTKSDYTYDASAGAYVYSGGNSSDNTVVQGPETQNPSQVLPETQSVDRTPVDDDPDTNDVNGGINENDGVNLNSNR